MAPPRTRTELPPEGGGLTLAEGPLPSGTEEQPIPIPVPDFDLSAPNDFNLSDCAPEVPAAPIPDISSLDLDKAGATLDKSPAPEPLEIDTAALELDAPGSTLIEEPVIPPPAIDTGGMSLSAPREGSLEDYRTPVEAAPLPNIDHLELAETSKEEKPQGKASFVIAED